MNRSFRAFLVVVAVIQAVFGVGFALRIPAVTQLWLAILPEATPLSLSFVGSIFAAAAASTLWCIVSGEDGALAGIGLDYLVILVPVTVFLFQLAAGGPLLIFAVLCILGAIFGAILFYFAQKIPIRDARPQPRLVRFAFGFFIVALLIVGGALVLKTPNVLPWPLSVNESVIYGWMFLGAAAYFVYALVRPSWGNSGGQLAGFLAYDVVLAFPFLARFGSEIPPQFLVGHLLYTAVVLFSGALAIYYLFINPETRLTGRRVVRVAA